MKNAGCTSLLSMLFVSTLAVGCSDKGQADTPPPTVESADKIEIALVASLSGPDQGVGAEAQRGALTAIGQINALGGIMGKQLALRIVDDASVPTTTKVKELAEKDKIVFGIGPSTSRTAKEILPIVKSDKILYITPSATSSELDCLDAYATPEETAEKCRDYKANFSWEDKTKPPAPILFKTSAPDSMLATALAQYASENVEGKRRCSSIAIVRQNDNYGIPISEFLRTRYQQLALRIADPIIDLDPTIGKTAELKDAAARVGTFATTGTNPIQCQVVIALPGVAAAYMRAFKEYKDQTTNLPAGFLTIGSDGFRQDQFIVEGRVTPNDPTSATAGEGSFAIAADTSPSTPEYNQFLALFQAGYPNVSPGRYSSTAYDAVVLLAGAMAKAKSTTEPGLVRKALLEISQGRQRRTPDKMVDFIGSASAGEDINYEGASGILDFKPETGNVPNDFGVWQIENAGFTRKRKFEASELSAE